MILEDLYSVEEKTIAEQELNYRISLNANHDIFKGHFPQQPVLPGVCQIQIILELLSIHFNQKIEIEKSKMIKFSAMIDPNRTPSFNLTCKLKEESDVLSVSAFIKEEEITFLKLSATLIRRN